MYRTLINPHCSLMSYYYVGRSRVPGHYVRACVFKVSASAVFCLDITVVVYRTVVCLSLCMSCATVNLLTKINK